MVLMIEASSACTTCVLWVVTTWPNCDDTTRSIFRTAHATMIVANSDANTKIVMRARTGSGFSRNSAVSDWYSRTILSGAGLLRGVRTERNDFMRRLG